MMWNRSLTCDHCGQEGEYLMSGREDRFMIDIGPLRISWAEWEYDYCDVCFEEVVMDEVDNME